MWTVPIVPEGLIAIVTEHAKAFRKPALDQPACDFAGLRSELLAMAIAPAVDVIKGQELVPVFTTTGARTAIMGETAFSFSAVRHSHTRVVPLAIRHVPLMARRLDSCLVVWSNLQHAMVMLGVDLLKASAATRRDTERVGRMRIKPPQIAYPATPAARLCHGPNLIRPRQP